MMVQQSFSLLLPNLLFGLCKGSRILRPYSSEFRDKLGYDVSLMEPSFKISAGHRVTPDMILASNILGHTLVLEWTEAQAPFERKKDQITRYAKTTSNDLINGLGLAPKSVNTIDVCVIVSPEAVASFNTFLTSCCNSPLIQFRIENELFELKATINRFAEPQTGEFFINGIQTERIPLHYLPFSIDDIQEYDIVVFVVRHLLSLVTTVRKIYPAVAVFDG